MMDPNNQNPPDPDEAKRNEAYQKVIDRLMNNAFVLNNDFNQRNETTRLQGLLIKISKSNEKLKRANRRLKKKIITRQQLLANYELRLAKSTADLFAMRNELAKSKEIKASDDAKIDQLMSYIKRIKRKLVHLEKMEYEWSHNDSNKKVKEMKQINRMGKIKNFKERSYREKIRLAEEPLVLKKIEKENEESLQLIKDLQNWVDKTVPENENFEMDLMEMDNFLSEPSKTSE